MQPQDSGPLVLSPKAIKKRPFQAQFVQITVAKFPNGQAQESRVRGRVYRDSEGRRRQEFQLEFRPGQTMEVAYIYDLTARIVYVLDMAHMLATSQRLPTRAEESAESSDPRLRKGQSSESALEMEIEGLRCRGYKVRQAEGTTVESWFSDDLQEVVLEKEASNRRERTMRVFNIRRIEPDGRLFSVPTGYKLVEGDIKR